MKIKTLLLAISLISAASLSAQMRISAGFTYGGISSTFGGLSADDVDNFSGDQFGVIMNFAPVQNFSIEPQFLVTKKGADIITESGVQKVRINYAELPILFNIRIPIGETIYPHVFAGPYFAVKLSQQQNPYAEVEANDPVFDEINLKTGDMGLAIGVGTDIVLGRIFLGINARYDYGTVRVGTSEYTPDLKNRSFMFNGTFGFVLVD